MIYPPMPQDQPPAPRRRKNILRFTLALAAGAGVLGAGVLIGQTNTSPTSDKPKRNAPTPAQTTPTQEPKDAAPTYAAVDEDSFAIELRTTSRHCFGSAGCNITVEPELTYLGLSDNIDPDATYEITYEIRGDENGPVIDTMELSDRTSLNYTPSLISTPSSGTKPTVKITDVISR